MQLNIWHLMMMEHLEEILNYSSLTHLIAKLYLYNAELSAVKTGGKLCLQNVEDVSELLGGLYYLFIKTVQQIAG